MNQKEKIEKIKEFRLIDDVFFEVFASDIPACQEILRTILEDEKLIVNDVIVQSSERNIYGRSVRLDALCTLGDGSLCNIEIQRSDNDNHLKRARFNAASITVKESEPGINFENVKDQKFDGFIITGAPVEQMPFEEVDYWTELREIFAWCESHVTSTLYICCSR